MVAGDPNQWARVLAGLEAVRQATRARGARTVLVVVHPQGAPGADVSIPEDRLAGLLRQANIERRWCSDAKMCPFDQLTSLQLPLAIH